MEIQFDELTRDFKSLAEMRKRHEDFLNRNLHRQERTIEQMQNTVAYIEKITAKNKKIQTEFTTYPYEKTRVVLKQYLDRKKFKFSALNKPVLEDLCYWLSGLTVQNESGKIEIDPKKGIFLCGGTGNGKTTLMKILMAIGYNESDYKFRGFKMTEMSTLLSQMAKGYVPTGQDYRGSWCFDDIGVNYYEVAKIYGNTFHPLPFLIDLMYNSFKSGNMIHMTSNLKIKEILYSNPNEPQAQRKFKDGFDERIRSRIYEMFNVIVNEDIDHRIDN